MQCLSRLIFASRSHSGNSHKGHFPRKTHREMCHESKEQRVAMGGHHLSMGTLPKTNLDPDNGNLEDCFPLPTSGFQGPC